MHIKTKLNFLIVILILWASSSQVMQAQIAINHTGAIADNNAMLDVSSSTMGVLIPRMSSTNRNSIISPATGLMVYDTDEDQLYYFNGNIWSELSHQERGRVEDSNGDTYIETESSHDVDNISIVVEGEEILNVSDNSLEIESNLYMGWEEYPDDISLLITNPAVGGFNVYTQSNTDWQSFTATSTILLDRIGLRFGSSPGSNYDFILYEGQGIEGTIVGTSSIANPVENSYNGVYFSSSNIELKKGYVYTLWFSDRHRIGFEKEDPYTGGRSGNVADWDYIFRVYGKEKTFAFSYEDGVVVLGDINERLTDLEQETTNATSDISSYNSRIDALSGTFDLPVGTIQMWHSATIPSGWLLCDGSPFNDQVYPELSNVLNSNLLPNFNGRFMLGTGNSNTTYSSNHALQSQGGEEKHTLTLSELPSHTHEISYLKRSKSGSNSEVSDMESTGDSSTTGSTGGGQSHNNMPPYLTVNFIIKAN